MNIEARLNENEIYISNQIKIGVKYLTDRFTEKGDLMDILHLKEIIINCKIDSKVEIYNLLAEDRFFKLVLRKLKQFTELESDLEQQFSVLETSMITMVLTIGSDGSKLFCEKLVKSNDFIHFARFVMEKDFEHLDLIKTSLVSIINNICFQTDCTSIKDLDIKVFLMRRVGNTEEKLSCVFTLLRISSHEEIEQFESEICSILEEYLRMLKEAVENYEHVVTDEERFSVTSLEELLKQLKPLSKCEKARLQLGKDESFREECKKMLKEKKYLKYSKLLIEELRLFFSDSDLSSMRNEE